MKKENSSILVARLLPFSIYILQRSRFMERFPLYITKLHLKYVAYYGINHSMEQSKQYIARMMTYMLLSLSFFTLIGIMFDISFLAYGCILTVFIPMASIHDLNKKIKRKKRRMLLELPEFLNKLTLLVDAGETVQKAISRCVEHKQKQGIFAESDPLYYELSLMAMELRNNRSFQHVLEDFSKRCNVQEISIFTTTVLLNYRRGGIEFVYALRDLSRIIWDKRMMLTKTLGEEASSKLVFPMVLIFFIVMVIVAAPAILIMNSN
ncbi:MAG: type secretion protein [Bacilli bacterium]|nr:type secretion protein [Bacilli bacterium]